LLLRIFSILSITSGVSFSTISRACENWYEFGRGEAEVEKSIIEHAVLPDAALAHLDILFQLFGLGSSQNASRDVWVVDGPS